MPKVDYKNLEEITKFLDSIKPPKNPRIKTDMLVYGNAVKLSKMIKDKYTEIKPDYEK
jgi:hypothetical protein